MGKKVDNIRAIQTGENAKCLSSEKVTNVVDVSLNHNKPRNGLLENQNGNIRYIELTRILGLKRMDSEATSDITDYASARGSTQDLENGAYVSPSYAYHDEKCDFGNDSRRSNEDMNIDSTSTKSSAPPLNDSSRCGKMKFLCSFGGKILPRPSDGKLRYIGGDTRIVSIRNDLLWDELVKKTSEICKVPHSIKYQLPGEDLDALISVSSDEDLQNMIEEYQAVEKLGGSQRVRIFLVPLSESEIPFPLDTNVVQQDNPDYQYVVALNGITDPSSLNNHEQLSAGDKVPASTFVQPPPISPVTGHQGDTRSGYTPLYTEIGLNEASCSFSTSQFHLDNNIFEGTSRNSSVLHEIERNNPPVSSVESLAKTPSIKFDPFPTLSLQNPPQALPARVTMDPLSQAIKASPSVDELTDPNIQLRNDPEILIRSEEYVDKILWGSTLDVPASERELIAPSFPTDLLCDFTDDLASNESPIQGAVYVNSHKREVSLIDEDFAYNPDQKDFGSGIPEFSDPQNKGTEATSPQNIDTSLGEFLTPRTVEAENVFSASDSENEKAKGENKGQSITNAMITEMEAEIYGLQIIKNSDLEEMRELGSGTYGTVFHGKWRGSDVAIKRIKSSCFAGSLSEQDRLSKDFWREAQILSNLHHPNVVAFYGVVPDGAGGTLATVTEYMANGSLRSVLMKKDRFLDRRKKLIIAMDAAFGMEYLHSKNIVHFDLKCDNLLVNLRDSQRPICKVGDFGLSRIKRNTLVSGGVRGTLPWMAPELLNGSSNRVSEKVDVFSFGITMWEIITGEEPYANMHCGAIIGGILKDTLRPPMPKECDPEWRNLIELCWSTNPDARPSFTEITNRLRSMEQNKFAK